MHSIGENRLNEKETDSNQTRQEIRELLHSIFCEFQNKLAY